MTMLGFAAFGRRLFHMDNLTTDNPSARPPAVTSGTYRRSLNIVDGSLLLPGIVSKNFDTTVVMPPL